MEKPMAKKKLKSPTLGGKIKGVLANYFMTQFVLMVVTAILAWGILTILKIKYVLILAILTGALSAIPNFGILIATTVAVFVAIFDQSVFLPNSPPIIEGFVVLMVFILLNKFVDLFLAPFFLGKTNKINPLLLFALILFGTIFFGVPGAILSVPLFLVIRTAWKHYKK